MHRAVTLVVCLVRARAAGFAAPSHGKRPVDIHTNKYANDSKSSRGAEAAVSTSTHNITVRAQVLYVTTLNSHHSESPPPLHLQVPSWLCTLRYESLPASMAAGKNFPLISR